MGCISSKLYDIQEVQTKQVDKIVNDFHEKDKQISKLLLLGAGQSGKSTLQKQMIEIYGKGYSESDRKTFIPIINKNIIENVKTILEWTDKLESLGIEGAKIDPENNENKKYILSLKRDFIIDQKTCRIILKFYKEDEGFKKTIENSSKYQLSDSFEYFLNKLDKIVEREYIPTKEDVFRSRVKTTGIAENSFEIKNKKFKLIDVGGQRSERKKWIHCFEDVTAVIFVAAISEYDQVLYENENINRMQETLDLFDEVCNSPWFKETNLILFLNKKDIFIKKIKKVPITHFFKEYTGDIHNYDELIKYIIKLFQSRNHSTTREIYAHITNATDTENITHVFSAVIDTIIKSTLKKGGLL